MTNPRLLRSSLPTHRRRARGLFLLDPIVAVQLDRLKRSCSLSGIASKPERTILSTLFPRVRAEILGSLFITLKEQRYVRELMRMSGLALSTIQDELRILRPRRRHAKLQNSTA